MVESIAWILQKSSTEGRIVANTPDVAKGFQQGSSGSLVVSGNPLKKTAVPVFFSPRATGFQPGHLRKCQPKAKTIQGQCTNDRVHNTGKMRRCPRP